MKLLITNKFQEFVNMFHRIVGKTEWSGTLFYKIEGELLTPDCKFIPQYIYPMDVGTSASTKFEYSNEILNAYDIFPDAEDCKEGLVHTHHSMGASFSNVDQSEIIENAENYDVYLSLVVDFQIRYVAKVAIKPDQVTATLTRNGSNISFNIEPDVLISSLEIEYEETIHADVIERLENLLANAPSEVAYSRTYYPGQQGKLPLPKTSGVKNPPVRKLNNLNFLKRIIVNGNRDITDTVSELFAFSEFEFEDAIFEDNSVREQLYFESICNNWEKWYEEEIGDIKEKERAEIFQYIKNILQHHKSYNTTSIILRAIGEIEYNIHIPYGTK